MSTTNDTIRTRLSEAIHDAITDPEPLIAVAGQAVEALHDIDAMAEHERGCGGNGLDVDTCVKCRVQQALA